MKGVGDIFVMYEPLFTLFTLLQINYISPKEYHKLFVYDDFKRNEPCHSWLIDEDNGESSFVQEGHTVQKYPLVVVKKIAFLLNDPGVGHKVIGEVYNVDDKMLDCLDFELDVHLLYFRRLESIQLINSTSDKNLIECWTYFWNHALPNLSQLPMISRFHSTLGDEILRQRNLTKRPRRVFIRRSRGTYRSKY